MIREDKEISKVTIMDPLRFSNRTCHFTQNTSQHACRSRNLNEETRVLEIMKSLLNWLTQRNFDNIKEQLVQTIRGCPSTFTLKSLVSCVFDMAMVDNAYIVFARLCVELFRKIPPFPSDESYGEFISFERLFLSKCWMELKKASSVTDRLYVEVSISGRFVKIVRLLIELFNNRMVSERTWQSIIQMLKNPIFSIPPENNINAMDLVLSAEKLAAIQFSDQNLINTLNIVRKASQGNSDDNLCEKLEKTLEELRLSQRETCEERSKRVAAEKETQKSVDKVVELESKYSDEIRLRKKADDAQVRKNEELDALNRLLESYKEELDILRLQAEALEGKLEDELRLRKQTEGVVAIEREATEKVRLQLQTLEHELGLMRANAEEFESKYKSELMILRKESELELEKERTEVETMKELLETCRIEQENVSFEARTWETRYSEELSLRKETDDALVKVKEELMMVKGLLISYNEEADAMREKRDNALKTVKELKRKQIDERLQTPPSFTCPITQEVMKDPHVAADGFTYEAEAISRWLNTGHETSPMTNLKLSNRTLVPNRALRSAIEELVSNI